ncbi:FliM/FliN family flagellar motor switch protein [Roseateles violae]|uniref:FliM/FliN family flagellar motor switch protein n=1 Tax=Roseateles violae TaxID=3058042 RepID=A0ABT8DU21_9BURK|nr:FliM/FliN family flagellar motor switch protein [Pelomonas sp. PFR6]MDN3921576.1 FliM/FliN family flagellar motor switch protein [Pelomonas sp. PFR6]
MTPKPNPYEPLDPRSLGRPVHLLRDFAAQLGELLNDLFRQQLNRRYRAAYELDPPVIEPFGSAMPAGAWLSAQTAQGRVSCLLERGLVLSVMGYRYGTQEHAGDAAPETTTEERLHGLLGRQLLQGLAARLAPAADEEAPALLPVSVQAPAADACLIRVQVREGRSGLRSQFCIALDPDWMAALLRERAVPRNKPSAALPDGRTLAAQLKLKLVARLLQTELPLGELLELRPGSVIPVRLQATEVLVDGSRLFTASVAEHQGKLCLTSFEDAE